MHPIIPKNITKVIEAIIKKGGRPFLAGGAVRDSLLKIATKDLDFEVYNISIDSLMSTLAEFGRVDAVGRSFGVIKLWINQGKELDFSLPRRESKIGLGHKGFLVSPDSSMTYQEACARRDFTINAMLMNPTDGTILDFFNGKDDLDKRILRHTSDHFIEDPLRPLRAVQLAARFGLSVDPDTAELCASMVDEALHLPIDRIRSEFEKWVLRSSVPSVGLKTLVEIGWYSVFFNKEKPDEEQLNKVSQVCAIDKSAIIADRDKLPAKDRIVLFVAALVRNLSKPSADRFLEKIGMPLKSVQRVHVLISEAEQFEKTGLQIDSELIRSSIRLGEESIRMLVRLLSATSQNDLPIQELMYRAETLKIIDFPPEPLLQGRDLIDLGIAPGPIIGKLMREVFEAQLSNEFNTKEDAILWISSKLEINQP